jgi:serine/threonine protein kinase
MSYLHSFKPPIFHRDLKLENIMLINDKIKLLGNNFNYIIDFGRLIKNLINSCTTKEINFSKTLIKDLLSEEIDMLMNTTQPYR